MSDNKNQNKPISLDEWLKDKPTQEVDLCREAARVNNAYLDYIRYHCCAICDKELSDAERETLSPYSFLRTCNEHRKYSGFFLAERVREMLAQGKDPLEHVQKVTIKTISSCPTCGNATEVKVEAPEDVKSQ